MVIYPNDHGPPHVHVIGGGNEAVFNLEGSGMAPTLRGSHGFATVELARIADALINRLPELRAEWKRIHADH